MNDRQNVLLFREPGCRTIYRSAVDDDSLIRHSDAVASNTFDASDQHFLSIERAYDYAYVYAAHWFISIASHKTLYAIPVAFPLWEPMWRMI
jgi:hypothetical protein